MPAYPSREELEYVTAQLAAIALERAGAADGPLMQVTRAWFPDHDAIDWRKISSDLAKGIENTRALVLQRLAKFEQQGKARCPGGQVRHRP